MVVARKVNLASYLYSDCFLPCCLRPAVVSEDAICYCRSWVMFAAYRYILFHFWNRALVLEALKALYASKMFWEERGYQGGREDLNIKSVI
jgi:hypothetical protein